MLNFKKITPEDQEIYQKYLCCGSQRGCEYSFANLYLWGRQYITEAYGHAVLFSQFNRRTVYPFPVGNGDKKAVLEAIILDAKERGIPCRITSILDEDRETLESLFPGKFRFHCDRDSYDYVYDIHDLADLKGRKYQKKRNHCNRFRQEFPDYEVVPITEALVPQIRDLSEKWYAQKLQENPEGDYHMEKAALLRALDHYNALAMDGLALCIGEEIVAFTMGSFMCCDTVDVHFEKALSEAEGAYPVINFEFARYIRNKYPQVQYLNREDDMGLEGLRKAKLSYCPHHLVEKSWACLLEDGYDY